jgi:hypothetical protein
MLQSNRRKISLQITRLAAISKATFLSPVVFYCAFVQAAHAHSGLVDGYGCHRGSDKVSYHCHEGEFVGQTFKSREEFLRRLRQGKSEQLSPRGNPAQPPPPQKRIED